MAHDEGRSRHACSFQRIEHGEGMIPISVFGHDISPRPEGYSRAPGPGKASPLFAERMIGIKELLFAS